MSILEERLQDIKDHPERHHHSDQWAWDRCCKIDGAENRQLLEAHEAICSNCGRHRDQHIKSENGGYDCPPRADGKVPIVRRVTVGAYWPGDDDREFKTVEWVEPTPKNAIEVLQRAADRKG